MRCFAFYSCDCAETNVKMIKSIVRARTCEKRPTGKQSKFLSRQCKLQESSGGHRISVWSFQQMSNVLKAAGDRKIKEVQMCLEGGYLVVVSNDVVSTQDDFPKGWVGIDKKVVFRQDHFSHCYKEAFRFITQSSAKQKRSLQNDSYLLLQQTEILWAK